MSELKKCDCGKTISYKLGICWTCWNEMRSQSIEHYCTCGIDVTPEEAKNECKHLEATEEQAARISAEGYKHIEFWCTTTAELDGSWMALELTLAREHLLKQIDIALENGSRKEFLELSAKLNELMTTV